MHAARLHAISQPCMQQSYMHDLCNSSYSVNTLSARQSYDSPNPKPKGGRGGMICNPMYFVPSGVYIHLWLMAVFLVYIAPFGGVLVVFNHGRQNGHFFWMESYKG